MNDIFSKWIIWYLANRPVFATMDDMLKDAFMAGWQSRKEFDSETTRQDREVSA